MRNFFVRKTVFTTAVFFVSMFVYSTQSFAINRIEGQVYDQSRFPLSNVYVELLSDVNSLLSRTKTNAAGRFTFIGMPSGRFIIKVTPAGTNLLEESQDVEIVNSTRFSSDAAYVDFYLRVDKRFVSNVSEKSPEAIFSQEIPQEAQRLYETGVSNLEKNKDKGLKDIEQAIDIFPDYFNALARLGQEYNELKNYNKAYPYLLKAIDVNPRSFNTFYSLTYAFYQLKQIPAALKAAQATTVLNGNSPDAQLLYGILLMMDGKYQDAEKAMLKAKSLAKKAIPEIHYQIALLYNKLNRNQEAADELEFYLKVYPDSPNKKEIRALVIKLRSTKKT